VPVLGAVRRHRARVVRRLCREQRHVVAEDREDVIVNNGCGLL
jgi:hypothetical protein